MKELQIFNHPMFGEIRTWIEADGNVTFCAPDSARALGYKDTVNAIKRHCKKDGVAFHHLTDSLGRTQNTKFLTQGNVLRLAANSELPGADAFESWIFDEVVPSVLNHGEYITPKRKQQRLGEVNSAARIILPALKAAGMAPQFVAVAMKSLYAPVGVEIPLEGITLNKRLFDATAIAKHFGILSKSGNPHGQAVSAIITQVDVLPGEKELVPFQNGASGHSGTNVQYTESVVAKVGLWLDRNGYPTEIYCRDKSYKVSYERRAA